MEHDIVGDCEIVAVMVAGTVHEQQDELLAVLCWPMSPGKSGSIPY
jgi:hypothetical protein